MAQATMGKPTHFEYIRVFCNCQLLKKGGVGDA